MKLSSIFLLAAYVLVISNQQLHNPKLLGRRPYWWQTDRQSPHYPANNNGPVLFNNDQSVNHPNYNQFQNDIPVSFHQFKPGKPLLIQNDGIHPSSTMDYQNEFVELFPDSQLRTNGLSRYRPDLRSSLDELQDRRLFFSGITLSTFFTKTVTFSVTVSLTLTITTTSCIPLALFAVPIQTSACRRKREILDYDFDPIPEEYHQFGIASSRKQEIILPTAVIPSAETNRLNLQVSVDQSDQLSANDVIPGSLSPERHVVRGKRYFILSVTSTTVTTYSITSTAVTKSVRLVGDMQVLCVPSGYIVC